MNQICVKASLAEGRLLGFFSVSAVTKLTASGDMFCQCFAWKYILQLLFLASISFKSRAENGLRPDKLVRCYRMYMRMPALKMSTLES